MKTINRASRIVGAMIALATVFVTMRSNASNGDFNSSYTDAKVIARSWRVAIKNRSTLALDWLIICPMSRRTP
jgi:hypothetical protein